MTVARVCVGVRKCDTGPTLNKQFPFLLLHPKPFSYHFSYRNGHVDTCLFWCQSAHERQPRHKKKSTIPQPRTPKTDSRPTSSRRVMSKSPFIFSMIMCKITNSMFQIQIFINTVSYCVSFELTKVSKACHKEKVFNSLHEGNHFTYWY